LQGHYLDRIVLCYARIVWDIALRTTVLLHTGCSTRLGMADGSYHGMDSESQDTDRPALPFDIRWSDYRHRYRVVLPADSRRYDDTMPCPEGVRDLTSGQAVCICQQYDTLALSAPQTCVLVLYARCSCFAGYTHCTVLHAHAMPCHASEMGMVGNAARTPCLGVVSYLSGCVCVHVYERTPSASAQGSCNVMQCGRSRPCQRLRGALLSACRWRRRSPLHMSFRICFRVLSF
jgi:hypothetical protein